jgi:hypothetical protein
VDSSQLGGSGDVGGGVSAFCEAIGDVGEYAGVEYSWCLGDNGDLGAEGWGMEVRERGAVVVIVVVVYGDAARGGVVETEEEGGER